jgi:replication factor C large subunit
MMWSEIYRPQSVEQMIGNEDERLAVMKWLSRWINGSRPLLLVGPSGVGKTTLVKVLARKYNYDLIEMNASDARNREDLETLIWPMFNNTSVSGRTMLLFLDEVDGISGRDDAGGIESLVKMMKEPTIPVIMAANTQDNTKIKQLAKVCKIIKFNPIPPREVTMFLEHVLKSHNKELGTEEKILIVNSSRGDIRSLLNSVQGKVAGYNVVRENAFEIDIAGAINGYFSSTSLQEAKTFLVHADATYPDPRFGMSSDERRKDKINALYSSIVSSRIGHENTASLLDMLSKVDVIVGRIGRNRRWSLLKYLDNIIAYGLFEKSRNRGIKYNQYSFAWPVMAPIFSRGQSTKILSDLAEKTHNSKSIFGSFYLPYLVQIMINNQVDPQEFARYLSLDEKVGDALVREMERTERKNR